MSNSLFVPIELDVLMANSAVIGEDDFRWWQFNYDALENDTFESPESYSAFASGPSTKVADAATNGPGAYLHWTLPRSLRSSAVGDTNKYPLVPNRWLVIRTTDDAGTKSVIANVIQSDCPNSTNGDITGAFMVDPTIIDSWKNSADPVRSGAAYVTYGYQYNIAESGPGLTNPTDATRVQLGLLTELDTWKEPTTPGKDKSFLTAIAPGNLAYSGYYPHAQGMFTFYDDLAGVPVDSSVSYFVTGWYSDPADDIIATGAAGFTGGTTIEEVLSALNWTVAAGAVPGTIDRSLYTGMSFQMQWDGNVATDDELQSTIDTKNVNVSIGNSDIDAFTSLIAAQLALATKYTAAEIAQYTTLLRAFQYDLLPELNKVNGDALLNQKNRNKWFQTKYGGTQWTVTVENGGTMGATEEAWVTKLNVDQQNLDVELQTLFDLQWQLNTAWYKYGVFHAGAMDASNLPANYDTNLASELDQSNASGVLAKLMAQFTTVNNLMAKVPQPAGTGTQQDQLQNGIGAFAASKNLPTGMTLKAITQPGYWLPNNPNIVVSGIKSPAIANPNNDLIVRLDSQLITQFTYSGQTASKTNVPGITVDLTYNSGAIPAEIISLYQEFALLDPSNATIIASTLGLTASDVNAFMTSQSPATNYGTGILPTNSQAVWAQDWAPLYMDWKITYAQIPYEYGSPAAANWTFDGTDYQLVTKPNGVQADMEILGRSLLSPHIQFTLGDKINSFLKEYAAEEQDLSDLYTEIQSLDEWQFLSQELSHLNDFFTQRDPRPFRRPTTEALTAKGSTLYADLVGFAGSTQSAPYITPSHVQGLVNSVPALQPTGTQSDFNFHAIRSAQAYISELYIYDKFGRTLTLVDDSGNNPLNTPENFPLIADAALTVPVNDTQITGIGSGSIINSPFQLPPRLLQPAKLNMLLVDQKTNTDVLGQVAGVNPISGWIIPNHLDNSLMLFNGLGTNVGQLSLMVPTDTNTTVGWTPPIDNATITTVADITADYPELGGFITGLVGKSPVEFNTFLGAIDSTLWTTAPLGRRTDQNLSVLIGRPLALTTVQLQFLLDGAPITSQDWPEPVSAAPVLDPKVPEFTTAKFSIRLGDMATREDGVIGYFTGNDYSVFNAVAAPQSTTSYVSEIGPIPNAATGTVAGTNYINLPFDGVTSQLVTMLVDPRASIHATTGILPTTTLKIPSEFIDPVLSKISLYFRTGPLLTKVSAAETGALYANNINYLPISEKNGQWSWWEKVPSGNGWEGYGLTNASLKAAFKDGTATINEGYLKFDTDLE